MTDSYQIPRFSLAWVLAALIAVILPHLGRMPVWLIVVCALCIAGRVFIFQGRMSYPGSLLKSIIVIVTVTSILTQFGRDIFSTDATVAILIAGMTLKLLEMRNKRDVLIVIYLSYFTVIAEFIYSQSIPIALYMSFCILLTTSAFMSLNQSQAYQKPLRTIKLSGLILLQSVPIMLVLFVMFPRISPLWSAPLQTKSAVTGLSDNMSPGDIGELIGSADVAFRVKFDSQPPASAELYWRGITLDTFTGRQWHRSFSVAPQFLGLNPRTQRNWFNNIEYQGNVVSYNVIMEPTYQNWIYTLKIPQILDDRLLMRRDFQVDTVRPIGQRFSYDARSYLNHRVDASLTISERMRWLILPEEGNQQSRDFALQMRSQADSDREYVNTLLTYFRDEEFFYTLEPGLLGKDTIDEFLFTSRKGFCEHYASSFTYLMRAAGVPARVVTGYQGGEFNPYDDTLTVRQYDAHAWSEVWLPESGWVRVDPTAAVAPDRIDLGSQLTLQEEENFLENSGFSMLNFRNSFFLNDLRFRIEMIDYSWNRFVLNYNQDSQFQFFSRLFGTVTKQKILLTLAAMMTLTIGVLVLIVLRKPSSKKQHPATLLYLRYCEKLAKYGLARHSGEAPQQYCQRLSLECPQWSSEMKLITNLYVDIVFKQQTDESSKKAKLHQLKQLIGKFRLIK